MGSRYLTDLADVMRRTGYPVIEVDGWQNRARGSGGYNDGKPDHVMCHHTASGPGADGWDDVNYCTFHDDDAPLCNLYLERSGTWYICAAGGTNTNGSGDCPHLSPDTMNSSAIGIEAGNGGTGEPWPEAQQDSYVKGCGVLTAHYGIPAAHCESHAEWAPSRKSDPYGPSRWGDGTWNMDGFRGELGDTGGEGFLMALTDAQQAELHARIMGSLPGPYTDEQRGPGGAGDGKRRYVVDDQDGNYIVTLLERIAAKLGA